MFSEAMEAMRVECPTPFVLEHRELNVICSTFCLKGERNTDVTTLLCYQTVVAGASVYDHDSFLRADVFVPEDLWWHNSMFDMLFQ